MSRHLPPVLAAAILAGCASSGSSGSTTAASTTTPAAGAGRTMIATLAPQNYTGGQVSGRIRLVPTGRTGELRAEISLRGAGYQNQLPWVIRTGRCGESGQDVGNPLAYRQITTGADGAAQLNATVQVAIPEGETVHVAVLRSPTQRDQVIACGVLSYDG